MRIGDIELKWLGHSGFIITPAGVPPYGGKNKRVIYIDPYNIKEGGEKADLILITHSHYDHCSVADMNKIVKEGTRIVITADCQSKINRFNVPVHVEIIEAGQELEFGNIKLNVLPAYNIDKLFHPKDEGWVGYLIKMQDVLIYHAGDTDVIPEMQKLTGYNGKKFVALLPIGGRFTMTAEEACDAVRLIKPSLAIPMHYGSIVGDDADAEEFIRLCKELGIEAEKLGRE